MAQAPVKRLHKISPIILKKNALKIGTLKSDYDFLLRCVKNAPQLRIKEDVIYRSTDRDFLKGKYPELVLINRLNLIQNSSQTIASYTENSVNIKLTSDALVRMIGQKNYDTVFSALCSTISLESRVRGILALLSQDKIKESATTAVQTIESYIEVLKKQKIQRGKRKKVRPYVITDHLMETKSPKKIVINPEDVNLIKECNSKVESPIKSEKTNSVSDKNDSGFPDLKLIINEDSNISETSISNISLNSCDIPSIVENSKSLLTYIENHTVHQFGEKIITIIDGSTITLKGNPDDLHLTTPDILRELTPVQQKKLLWHQTYVDWKLCLQRDEDFNLPLHWAVLNDDLELLRRQCSVLKIHHESVDIVAAGNMTALQMSLADSSAECTKLLLQHGADVLGTDEQTRTALHLAAERDEHHTRVVLEHCRNTARQILKDNEELREEGFEEKSDAALAEYLLNKINAMCDDEGYTPLMVASKAGKQECVKLLVQSAPYSVNQTTPTCGNTALYLAVTEACVETNNSENKSKINDNFMKTIECLVENGADPSIFNNYGASVNDLLNEFNFTELSMLIANKLTSIKYMGGKILDDFSSYMLVKNPGGEVNITQVRESFKTYKKPEKTYHFKKHTENDKKDEIKEHIIESVNEKNSDINIGNVIDNVDSKRKRAIKSNSKEYVKSLKLDGHRKEQTTIYKTLPVVKVVSFINNNDKDISIAQNKAKNVVLSKPKVSGTQTAGILLKAPLQSNMPIKILPKLSKSIKVSPVAAKRPQLEPQSEPTTKKNKSNISKTLIIKK